MRVGLFVPCYVDQFYPDVAMATVELLERYGVEIDFPREQTCCGQPMANTGCKHETRPLAMKFLKIFRDYRTSSARRAAAWRWCGTSTGIIWRGNQVLRSWSPTRTSYASFWSTC